MDIEKNFYDLVEQPGYLKHILYGDSVSKNSLISYKLNNKINHTTIENLWNELCDFYNVKFYNEKEYLFFQESDNFQILNFNILTDTIEFKTPKYLMRHYHSGQMIQNWFADSEQITTTLNHSLVYIDIDKKIFIKQTPEEAVCVPRIVGKYSCISSQFNFNNYKDSDGNIIFSSVVSQKIEKKEIINYRDYVYDFEIPETHIFIINDIVVHNTDSLYIQIPYCPEDTIEKIKVVNKTANDINDLIVNYNKSYLLPRCGFSPNENQTFFKEEMILDVIIMLDVKKAYAYRQLTAEAEVDPETNKLIKGKIFSKPKITKKSGLGVKSDTILMTKLIMNDLIDISLDIGTNAEKYNKVIESVGSFHKLFMENLKNFKISSIGVPVRWQKKLYVNHAMKLYNAIIEPVFQFLSPGYFVYCKFNNMQLIKNTKVDLPFEKLNALVFPHKFDSELVLDMMKKYQIEIDYETQWTKILNKTCHSLINNIKPKN